MIRQRRWGRSWHRIAVLLGALLLCSLPTAWPAHAGVDREPACDLVAATDGDDDAAGTFEAPLRTVQALVDALGPGDVGCLREGVHEAAGGLAIRSGGEPGARTVLRSHPGERATVRPEGLLYVAGDVTNLKISGLDIDGSRNTDVTVWIQGDDITLSDVDVTNAGNGESCVLLGSGRVVQRVHILGSRIHDCGSSEAFDHGVYVRNARDVKLLDTVITGAAAWGVQLYPDAHGTLVARNVIDGNGGGVIIGGAGDSASSGNVVTRNVIAHSVRREPIAEFWAGAIGTGNWVVHNCVWPAPPASLPPLGYASVANVVVEPQYVDREGGDLRLQPGTACSDVLGCSPPAGRR